MTDDSLTISELHENGALVVAVAGRIDSANASRFGEKLFALFDRGETNVLVDFAELLYLTSAGFRALLVGMDRAEANGARMVLCAMPPAVLELFEMGGLSELFEIFSSRTEALSA
jgi:anti-sigma B factor antagonist